MLINKVLFIHIPKTAGTSMEVFLGQIYGYSETYIQRCIHGLEPNTLDLGNDSQHKPITEYSNILPTLDFIFTIVRNPYDRLISAYSFFKLYIERTKYGKLSRLNFQDWFFKEKIESKNLVPTYNYHLLPQTWYLDNYIKQINIYKYETLNKDIEIIKNNLQISHNITFPHKFKTSRYLADYNDIKNILPEINKYYKEDFQNFGYQTL